MNAKPISRVAAPAAAFAFFVAFAAPVVLDAPVARAAPAPAPEPLCRVSVVEVKDIRADPSMGGYWLHTVHSDDPAGWVRKGLGSLSENKALTLVSETDPADVQLHVELVKAYVETAATATAANVVLRVTYSAGAAAPRVYRGVRTNVVFVGTDGERHSGLDAALNAAVADIRSDLFDICRAAKTAG